MSSGFVLYFNARSESIVLQMRKRLQSAGQKLNIVEGAIRPHLTLAVYDNKLILTEQIKQEFTNYCLSIRPFSLTGSSVGIFGGQGVIFLGITATPALLNLRQSINDEFAQFLSFLEPNFATETWVPHCTLAYGLSAAEVGSVMPVCMQFVLPVKLQVQYMAFSCW